MTSYRRHTYASGEKIRNLRVLPMDYMKMDVDLCGEVLISRMREIHINNLLQLLEVGIKLQFHILNLNLT
jgi:hypothetical protein